MKKILLMLTILALLMTSGCNDNNEHGSTVVTIAKSDSKWRCKKTAQRKGYIPKKKKGCSLFCGIM